MCCPQVVELVGLAGDFLSGLAPDLVPSRLEYMTAHVQQQHPELLREIAQTQQLSVEQRTMIEMSLQDLVAQLTTAM